MYFVSFSQVTIYGNDVVWGNRTAPCNLITNGSFETRVASTPGCANQFEYYVQPNRDRANLYTLPGWTTTGSSISNGGHLYSHSYMRSMGNWGTGGALPHGTNGFYFGNATLFFNAAGNGGAGTAASPSFSINANGLVSWSPAAPASFVDPGITLTSNNNCATTYNYPSGSIHTPVTLSQTVTGLTTGKAYHLEFWVEGESPSFYQYDGAFKFTSTGALALSQWFASPSAGNRDMAGNSTSIGSSQRYHIEFCATSTSATFTWTNYGHMSWWNGSEWRITDELAIDDIILNESPTGVSGTELFCKTQNKTISLAGALSCETSGGVWARTSGTGGTFTPATGTFVTDAVTTNSTFTYTITNSCGTYSSTVTVLQVECSMLPVRLMDFQAALQNNTAQISWATASEQNNKGFEIEKSVNGVQWEVIAFVSTKAINGNSDQVLEYNYADNALVTGKNYYRLKQIDIDGKISYSPVRWINMNNGTDIAIYPNPARDVVNIIGGRDWLKGTEMIGIVAMDGKLLTQKTVNRLNGTVSLDLSSIPSGTYFICIQGSRGRVIKKIEVIK